MAEITRCEDSRTAASGKTDDHDHRLVRAAGIDLDFDFLGLDSAKRC